MRSMSSPRAVSIRIGGPACALALARRVRQAGYGVLVDATFLLQSQRAPFRALAQDLQLPLAILAFDAPLPVLEQRVAQRLAQGGDASEATLQVLAAQLARREPLTEDELALAVQIDTTQPVDVSTLPALTA